MKPSDARNLAAPVHGQIGPVRWTVRSAVIREQIQSVLTEAEGLLARPEALVHDTWLVRMVRVAPPAAPLKPLLLRRSNYAKRRARVKDLFRPAAPLRAFNNALVLERAGFPTPRVLAAGVARRFQIPQAGYLLVEEIAPAISLARLTAQPEGIARAVVGRVAELVARLHEHGFIHGDLTINNILLDETFQPWFIDLERGRFQNHPLSWRQAVEDFHRFARHFGKFSPGAQRSSLRLLQHYCALRGWRSRTREFAQALQDRLRHKIEGTSQTK